MLLPLASEPYLAPTDRDMLPSERREFVRTHRTCVFGYRRRNGTKHHAADQQRGDLG